MAYIRNAAEDLKNIFKLSTRALQLEALSNSRNYTEEWATNKMEKPHGKMSEEQNFWAEGRVEREEGNDSEITDYSCLMEPLNAQGLDELYQVTYYVGDEELNDIKSKWSIELCPFELKDQEPAERTKLFCARNDSERAAILLVAWDDYYNSDDSNKNEWNCEWVDNIPTETMAGTLMMMSAWARLKVLDAFTSKNHKRTMSQIKTTCPKRTVAEMKWMRSEVEMKNGACKKKEIVTSGSGNTVVEAKENAANALLGDFGTSGVGLLLSASAPIRWRRVESGTLRDRRWHQLNGTTGLALPLAVMSDKDRAEAFAKISEEDRVEALKALNERDADKALKALSGEDKAKAFFALSNEDRAPALAALSDEDRALFDKHWVLLRNNIKLDEEGKEIISKVFDKAANDIAWMRPQADYGEPGIIDSAFWLVFSKVSIDEMQKYKYNIDSLASTSTLDEAGFKKVKKDDGDSTELVEDPTYYCLEKGTVGFYKMPEDYFKEIFDMKSEKAIDEMDEDGSFSKAKCSMWTRAQQENMCFYKRKETATHQFIKVDPELFDALCNKFGPDSHGTYSMKPGASAAGTGGLNAQPRRARPTQSDLIAFVQKKLDNKELEVEQHFKHMVFARKVKFKETIMITECDHGFDDDVHDVFAFQATENHVGEMFVCAGDLFKVNFKQDTKEIRDIVAHGANAFKQNFVAFTKQH